MAERGAAMQALQAQPAQAFSQGEGDQCMGKSIADGGRALDFGHELRPHNMLQHVEQRFFVPCAPLGAGPGAHRLQGRQIKLVSQDRRRSQHLLDGIRELLDARQNRRPDALGDQDGTDIGSPPVAPGEVEPPSSISALHTSSTKNGLPSVSR